jgi:dipeptidyl aminopeptidase/acylaminoacyl peptidase
VRVDERSNLWVAPLDRPADASQVTFGADRVDGATGLAWTPGGRLVYTSLESGNPDLWLVDASGGGPRQLTRDPAGDHRPVVTPDGRRIIFVSSRDPAGTCLWSVDVDGRAPKRLSDGPADGFPLVAPGAQTILFTSFAGPRLVRRLSLDTGATAGTQSGDAAGVAPPGFAARAISSDGASLVGWHYDSGRRGYGLTVVDLADGRLRPLGLTQFPPGPIAWVPGKDEFLYVDPNDASIWRRSAAGGPAARLTEPRAGRVYDLSVSPDGTRLALARGETLRNVVTMTVLPR